MRILLGCVVLLFLIAAVGGVAVVTGLNADAIASFMRGHLGPEWGLHVGFFCLCCVVACKS